MREGGGEGERKGGREGWGRNERFYSLQPKLPDNSNDHFFM